MAPPSKPPPGPVAVAGPEGPSAVLEMPAGAAKLETSPVTTLEQLIDPNAPPAAVAVDIATTPPPRENPAGDARAFLQFGAANASHTGSPEFSAPDVANSQAAPAASTTTETHLPAGVAIVASEHPVTVAPATPPEAAPGTSASPAAARAEAQQGQAAVNTAEPANTATNANPARQEATPATAQHPVETPEQTQQINAVLLEINKLLFEIGDINIAFTTLAAKANGSLPLGAELRRQVLEGIRKDFDARSKRGDRHKISNVQTAKSKIDSIYPPDSTFDPKESAFVNFLRKNKINMQAALPDRYDANNLIAKVEAGETTFAEAFQLLFSEDNPETKAFRRTLAEALTGATGVPELGYDEVLRTAGQQVTDKNVEQLKAAFRPKENVDWKKRSLTFGGLAFVLLMALAPMMMEGQGQGGGHG